ncbi:MAG: hypothetical protein CVU06_03610 [Bacteroidetes bacterium HGW-Bacteroidetes-22]|nr:MAG: hypothetical protein CVU06_03610 [Bacteroidetes bacterium HGW-Bacteroidetes-22]
MVEGRVGWHDSGNAGKKLFFCRNFSELEQSSNQLAGSFNVEQVIELARRVTGRYVARGVIPPRDSEDVTSAMLEKYLKKQDQILQSFVGKASLTTYLTAVFNRMCCEVIRSESRHWYAVSDNEDYRANDDKGCHQTEIDTFIASEVALLSRLIKSLGVEGAKLLLLVRFFYQLKINPEDVYHWTGDLTPGILEQLQSGQHTTKGERYAVMATVVNIAEKKNIRPDAVRMWFNKQMEVLLCKLNHDASVLHTRETLAVLFERLPHASGMHKPDVFE